jgi:hypothetical protein
MRKLLSGILLFSFYILFALLIAEGGVRLAKAAPPAEAMGWFWRMPDATTGWAMEPNTRGRSFNQMYEFDVAVAVNSRGLRSPEFIDYAKPEGVYRVLVLGDSFIEAIQVELEETFPQELGRLFAAESGRQVEVINAGSGGWGNDQQLLWLKEEGYKYSPDLIILAVYPRNDFMNNYEPLETANLGRIAKPFYRLENGELQLNYYPFNPDNVPPAPQVLLANAPVALAPAPPGPLTGLGEWVRQRSAFYRYFDPRIRIAAPQFAVWLARTGFIKPGQETKVVAQGENYAPLGYQIYKRQMDAEWQAAAELTAAIFAEFQRTATGMGAAASAVLINAPEQVYARDWESILTQYPAMRAWDLDLYAAQQRAAEAFRQAGVPVLDLVPYFQEQVASAPPLHYTVDGHWTPAGHSLAARATFNFLASNGMIPELSGSSVPVTIPAPGRSLWQWFVLIILALLIVSLVWDLVKTGPVRWLRKAGAGVGTVGELLGYMVRRRQFTLLPLVIVLLMFAGLLILAQASVVGPFIYTLI